MLKIWSGRFLRLWQLRRSIGTVATLKHAWGKLFGGVSARPIDAIGFYDFIVQPPFGEALPLDTARNTINWLIPDFSIGSGGHLNIFRLAFLLEQLGYECRIVIVGQCRFSSAETARACIREHFVPLAAQVQIGTDNMPPAWFTFATSWITAYYVHAFNGTQHKCYFVQDFEPLFYAAGSDCLFAENTYRFGFFGITAGSWLADKLANEYGMKTRSIGFSVEQERYQPKQRRAPSSRHVFFYARPPTARRAFEMGLLVLNEVSRRLPDVKFILAGWDVGNYKIPFHHLNAGMVALEELPDLYSQCDVALVISCTNLSLLPLELMACGCPVVSNRGANVEWLLNDNVAALADSTVESLSDALISVLSNAEYRNKLIQKGLDFSRNGSWQAEASHFASILNEIDSRDA